MSVPVELAPITGTVAFSIFAGSTGGGYDQAAGRPEIWRSDGVVACCPDKARSACLSASWGLFGRLERTPRRDACVRATILR
jgi:hypothetical protein